MTANLEAQLAVYAQATGHTRDQAISRLIEIGRLTPQCSARESDLMRGLQRWQTDPYYMPERVCGRVRSTLHHQSVVGVDS